MTKAISKAARRRIRKREKPITLANGDTAPPIRGQGARNDIQPPANIVVLEARARMLNIAPKHASLPILSDDAGRAIWLETGRDRPAPEQSKLWQILTDVSRAYATYCASIGVSPHAKCGKMEYLPDRFEARADDRPDLRTREEKDKSADMAWRSWKRAIESLPRGAAGDLWDGLMMQRTLVRDGKVTLAGQAFVQAMRMLKQVMEA